MSQDLDELRQLLALQNEVSRQRLRTAAAEAFVDDYQHKLGVNQAVYAAGYGIAPEGKRPRTAPTATATATATAEQPATPSAAAKYGPAILGGLLALGVGGGVTAWYQDEPAAEPPAIQMPEYDVEKWTPPDMRPS